MPRNGSGTYSVPAGTAAVSLQPIASLPYNTFLTDLSSEITNSLPTTGVKAMGANLPMGGNKVTNMADPSVLTDAATKNYVDNFVPGKVLAIQVLTTTGTYTRTTGATHGDVYVIGGGGAGGGASATTSAQWSIGGGAAGGSMAVAYNIALPATQAYTIGAGGTPNSGAGGGAGGTSTFGTISSPGGSGGPIFTAFASGTAVIIQGGTPGTASGGTVNLQGSAGSPGSTTTGQAWSGNGGVSPLGGGPAGTANGAGVAAASPGGGGSGAFNPVSTGARAGGAGAAGIIIVVERA